MESRRRTTQTQWSTLFVFVGKREAGAGHKLQLLLVNGFDTQKPINVIDLHSVLAVGRKAYRQKQGLISKIAFIGNLNDPVHKDAPHLRAGDEGQRHTRGSNPFCTSTM